jgi:hypothetical protein
LAGMKRAKKEENTTKKYAFIGKTHFNVEKHWKIWKNSKKIGSAANFY